MIVVILHGVTWDSLCRGSTAKNHAANKRPYRLKKVKFKFIKRKILSVVTHVHKDGQLNCFPCHGRVKIHTLKHWLWVHLMCVLQWSNHISFAEGCVHQCVCVRDVRWWRPMWGEHWKRGVSVVHLTPRSIVQNSLFTHSACFCSDKLNGVRKCNFYTVPPFHLLRTVKDFPGSGKVMLEFVRNPRMEQLNLWGTSCLCL